MKRLPLMLLIFLLSSPFLAFAITRGSVATVSVSSSSAGTTCLSGWVKGASIFVPSTAAGPIWIARIAGACASNMTGQHGIRLTAGQGYEFSVSDGFGDICCILESGSTPVSVETNVW